MEFLCQDGSHIWRDGSNNLLSVKKIDEGRPEEKDVLWVNALNAPLEFVPSHLHLNADEKPIIPDSPQSISFGRSASWTLMIYFRATGSLDLPMLLILPGNSVTSDAVEVLKGKNISITATENGYQTDNTFIEHLFNT